MPMLAHAEKIVYHMRCMSEQPTKMHEITHQTCPVRNLEAWEKGVELTPCYRGGHWEARYMKDRGA